MTRKYIFTALALLFSSVLAAQPITLHPQNPHYFLYKNKPAVLITSGEHYGALLNLDFNYQKYFDELHSQDLNMTRTFSGVYCEQPGAFHIESNTLAPNTMRYITPWARSSEPGYKNGGNKFDLTKWNADYFLRLHNLLKEAASRNIVVEFTLFCPFYEEGMWLLSPLHPRNNVNQTPDISRTDVYTTDKSGSLFQVQKTMVEKIVKEVNAFDNIIFEICNEPYFGGVTMEWQHAIADVITNAEKNLPKKHLVSQNIQNGSSKVVDPHPSVSVFNWHYAYPPETVALNYQLNKAIGDNETGFRGTSDSTYRFEAWRFILAGGALFNHLDYSFAVEHESGNYRYDTSTPGGGSTALRKQIAALKTFIGQFDFIRMTPDSGLITTPLRFNALSEAGSQYAVYFAEPKMPREIQLNVADGSYEVSWMHPLTGKYENTFVATSKRNVLTLQVPFYRDDLALKIVRKK